jgi:hypothetical protein
MGDQAGRYNQHANSIVLNASGSGFNTAQASSFYVKPVRGGNFAASALAYTSAGEVVEETGVHFDASGNVGIGVTNPSHQLTTSGRVRIGSALSFFSADNNVKHVKCMKYFGAAGHWLVATGSYAGTAWEWLSVKAIAARLDSPPREMSLNIRNNAGFFNVYDVRIIGDDTPYNNELLVFKKTSDSTYYVYASIDSASSWTFDITHRNSTIDEDGSTFVAGALDTTGLTAVSNTATEANFSLISGNVGIGTTAPYSKLDTRGDTIVNSGEANWDTGMKSLLGTQDLIDAGAYNNGSISASTDVDLPPEVVNDVIAKFVNSDTGEVVTGSPIAGYTLSIGDDIVFDVWIYNSSGSTISSEFFKFGGTTQVVALGIPSNSTWTKYTRTITASVAGDFSIRMDNNTAGTTFYFTGLSVRVNPSNTTNAPFTPKGFPLSGTGTVLSVPNIVAKEASIQTLLGNVGIGTTSPSGFDIYNTEINQTFRVDGTNIHRNNKYYVDSRDDTSPCTITTRYAVSAAGDDGASATRSELVLGATADENYPLPGSSFISFSDNKKLYLGSHPDEDFMSDWSTVSNQAYPRMGSNTFAPHVTLLPSGNVGIGTTSPQGLLHISSGTSGDAHLILEADTDNDNESDNPKIVFRQDGGYYTGEIGLGGSGNNRNRMVFRSKSTITANTGFIFYSNVTPYTSTTDIDDLEDTQLEVMRITGDGNVGIGAISPSTALDVNGTVTCTALVETSDDRIKYNEQSVSNALTLINQLRPQKYEKISKVPASAEGVWIPTDAEWESVKSNYEYKDEFGFIAQDVRAVPELTFLVHGEETRTDVKTVSLKEYSNLTTGEQNTYTEQYIYVSTEDPISLENYSNLTPEEQSQYHPTSNVYTKNDIGVDEYSNLTSDVQQTYTQELSGYTKEIETQTPLALDYKGLFVLAIGAIKELEARVAALESA